MNLRDLRYLVAVANHKSFTRAASAEHVTQPALSNQIKKLENELGVTIFNRGNDGISLSRFGKEIMGRASQIVELASSIEEAARSHTASENQTLRLGMTPTLAAYLSAYIRELLVPTAPDLNIFVVEEYPRALAKMVEQQSIDVALIARNSYDALYPTAEKPLEFSPLWFEPAFLAVGAASSWAEIPHIWAHEVPVHRLIRFNISFGYDLEKDLPSPSQEMMERMGIDVKTSRFETVCRYVAQTSACTLVNAIAAEQFKRDDFGLKFVPFADEGNVRELGALTLPDCSHCSIVATLCDRIRQSRPSGTLSSTKSIMTDAVSTVV